MWAFVRRVAGVGYGQFHLDGLRSHSTVLIVSFSLTDYHLGNTFEQVKMVLADQTSQSTRLTKMDLRYKVIGCRGVGTDIWDSRDYPGVEKYMMASNTTRPDGEESGVAVVNWDDAYGGLLRGFEERFYGALDG